MFAFTMLWFFCKSLKLMIFLFFCPWEVKGSAPVSLEIIKEPPTPLCFRPTWSLVDRINCFSIIRCGLKPALSNAKLLGTHVLPYLKTKSALRESTIFYLTVQTLTWADSSDTETASNHRGKWVLYDKACKPSCKAAAWHLTLWTSRQESFLVLAGDLVS